MKADPLRSSLLLLNVTILRAWSISWELIEAGNWPAIYIFFCRGIFSVLSTEVKLAARVKKKCSNDRVGEETKKVE